MKYALLMLALLGMGVPASAGQYCTTQCHSNYDNTGSQTCTTTCY